MKCFVPSTTYEANLPVVLTNWLFGLGVMEFPFGKPRRVLSILWSMTNFSIHLSFVMMANFSEFVEIRGSTLAANNYRIVAYFCVVFVAISLYLSQINAKFIGVTLAKLILISRRLEIMGIPKDYDVTFKYQMIQQCVGFLIILVLVTLDFKIIDFGWNGATSRFGFFMCFHYLLGFSFAVDSGITSCVRNFGNRFQRLNQLLVELDSKSMQNKPSITKQSQIQLPRYTNSVMREINRGYSLSSKTVEKQSLLYVLRETRKIHHGLSRTAMELNEAFHMQILCSVALSFGLITTLFYTTYIIAASSWNNTTMNQWIGQLVAYMWIAFYAIKIFVVVQACETTSSEAKRTRGHVSRLLDSPACDEEIRDEINVFSLQLIQNPLNFTANRFFSVNYELLTGMIGSVTTYLIIMIQMRHTYELEKFGITANSTKFLNVTNNTN